MDWGRILKTGAVAGIIYGFLQGIVSLLSYVFYREEIIKMITSSIPKNVNIPMSVEELADIGMISTIPGSLVGGIVTGIIFAFIFRLMYKELIGSKDETKGLFLSVLLAAGVGLGELAYPGVLGGIFLINTHFVMLLPLNFAFMLVLGYSSGMFYKKFGDEDERTHKTHKGKKKC